MTGQCTRCPEKAPRWWTSTSLHMSRLDGEWHSTRPMRRGLELIITLFGVGRKPWESKNSGLAIRHPRRYIVAAASCIAPSQATSRRCRHQAQLSHLDRHAAHDWTSAGSAPLSVADTYPP